MDAVLNNPFGLTTVFFILSMLSVIVFLFIFEMVTKYKKWEQIRKGNLSVALATSGKIFGIANVFRYAIQHNENLLATLYWGTFGFAMLMVAYFIFEFMTPHFKVDDEIEKDNRAVGLLSCIISVATSYVVGASIT